MGDWESPGKGGPESRAIPEPWESSQGQPLRQGTRAGIQNFRRRKTLCLVQRSAVRVLKSLILLSLNLGLSQGRWDSGEGHEQRWHPGGSVCWSTAAGAPAGSGARLRRGESTAVSPAGMRRRDHLEPRAGARLGPGRGTAATAGSPQQKPLKTAAALQEDILRLRNGNLTHRLSRSGENNTIFTRRFRWAKY